MTVIQSNNRYLHFALLLLIGGFLLSSCSSREQCRVTYTYTKYIPEYMTWEEFRAPDAVRISSARSLQFPGKIYIKDGILFINERGKGIHVIDNNDPSNPVSLSFIEIPGNTDLAAYGSYLYANSHVDLLTFDIHQPAAPTLLNRKEHAFPYVHYDTQTHADLDSTNGVVKSWKTEEVTEVFMEDCRRNGWGWGRGLDNNGFTMEAQGNIASGQGNGTGGAGGTNNLQLTAGIGGSMARFTIYDRYLYTVDESDLRVFDLANPVQPDFWREIQVGFGIETIFPYNNLLFIGSTTGMFIFDNSDPSYPQQVSRFAHLRACDPVVAEGNRAYVTLRGQGPCGPASNQLDVLDISDIYNPQLIRTYPMDGPFGLGIDNGTLFVCDGESGLKVYDASQSQNLKALEHVKNFNTYDVIPLNGVILVIGEDGFYQYDYSNPGKLRLLSKIPVLGA